VGYTGVANFHGTPGIPFQTGAMNVTANDLADGKKTHGFGALS
jgi:hypothetical protein